MAISAADRAYGVRFAGRAGVYGTVKRYEVVQAILSEVEPGPRAEKGPM